MRPLSDDPLDRDQPSVGLTFAVPAVLVPWAPGNRELLVRLVPESISGRRIELVSAVADPRGYL
jgi:hypothetical protein